MLDLVGRDGDGHAGQGQRAGSGARHREPMFGGRHVALLVRLPGRQQRELGQAEHVGEPAREREVTVVDRVERAAQQADAT
ncbi:hypothetical protein BamMEX5DRAFT_4009 [Burkholderia ambifaria MEX-5]|uniref:Uncharacterized protein n=1 Tax=Burkholderia ambifaria MEX-5 TaxID=396597 RepID=B1T893_9BURK|nr:hypothetical protein BamMEX5DRAFT_4009 [Burkholderia ambifaria MEX-5]